MNCLCGLVKKGCKSIFIRIELLAGNHSSRAHRGTSPLLGGIFSK